MQLFLDFSVEFTCFTRFELLATGQAQTYLDTAHDIVGPILDELLAAHAALPKVGRVVTIRRTILGDEKLGPVARAITKLWYIGIWYELPPSWTETYGARSKNTSFMVTPSAYAEGLLWRAIGAHAPGAKAPGYGSWKDPPVIPVFDCGNKPAAEAGLVVNQTGAGQVTPHTAAKPEHPPPQAEGPSA
jgi:hypothetical protein